MNRVTSVAAFAIGLAVVSWVGAGYIGSSPLALAVIAAIGAVYLAGAFELWRFDRATSALQRALLGAPEDRPQLDAWLESLPAALRTPVRLRIDGERVGLPGPVLAPYLVGLLVLLGMLGTFLGMVLTLHGAVAALETSTDLQAIRSALSAPVKGLGFAFGTSVAGVAASAMLGLVSALCRRARLRAAQLLDTKIAGSMRAMSFTHRRDRVFDALQSQAAALPELVTKLEAMSQQIAQQGRETSEQIAQQSRKTNERLLSGQQRFHDDAQRGYAELAASVDASLKSSLTESARLAGEAIRPAVAETMTTIAGQTGELQSHLAAIVERQLDGISGRFDTSVAAVAQTWTTALASHERSSENLGRQLQQALAGWADGFERRSATLLDGIAERSAEMQAGVARHSAELHAGVEQRSAEFYAGLAQRATDLHDKLADRSEALLASIGESASAVQAETASVDRARQAAFAQSLESMAAALRGEWEQLTAHSLAGQQQAFQELGDSVRALAETTQTQAAGTLGEVARLIESVAEAPRAAAEVIEQLRKELSASIARDNELLAERSRILEALGTLTASATQVATEQRDAVEGLVNASATMLERAGDRFTESVEAQSARFAESIDTHSARIAEAAGQVTVGAVEIAALGDAFGHAVRLFGESSDRLMTTLERIEGALEKSSARSDEQLGYYVAQAREIIDLSVASQKQVVEDLARLARNEAPPDTELSLADEA